MTDEQMTTLALLLCAAMDDGESCEGAPCGTCQRQATVAVEFLRPARPTLTVVRDPDEQHELDV